MSLHEYVATISNKTFEDIDLSVKPSNEVLSKIQVQNTQVCRSLLMNASCAETERLSGLSGEPYNEVTMRYEFDEKGGFTTCVDIMAQTIAKIRSTDKETVDWSAKLNTCIEAQATAIYSQSIFDAAKILNANGYIYVKSKQCTNAMCMRVHGHKFKLSGVRRKVKPPQGFDCRCHIEAVFKGDQNKHEGENYFSRLIQESIDVQNSMLGADKADILRNSGVSIDEFKTLFTNSFGEANTIEQMAEQNALIQTYIASRPQPDRHTKSKPADNNPQKPKSLMKKIITLLGTKG